MLEAFRMAARAALSMTNVLIVGEVGVGKSLLAGIIHEQSKYANEPFIPVNCGAIDSTLLAAELFGRAAGTGLEPITGLFARAGSGTLFLDEVTRLGPSLQARIAGTLRDDSFQPLGSFERKPFGARVIAASSRDVRNGSEGDALSEALLYEFGVEIMVPPLRRRPEDIAVLASYYLSKFAQQHEKDLRGFEPEALDVLGRYDWPGNVLQLRNAIERAVVASGGRSIRPQDLPSELTGTREQLQELDSGSVALEAMERRHIRQVWRITGGHLGETADLLGIHRNTLRRKLEQYGITDEDARV
jgi:DNA-binding NtrC family response regulator